MRARHCANRGFRVTQLSSGFSASTLSIAVFVHGEARCIRSALESIVTAAEGTEPRVYVLANGCTKSGLAEVRASASILDNLWLVEIDLADKANAWNLYVHDLFSEEEIAAFDALFFMDGDVALRPNTLHLLVDALDAVASAEAVGGMPSNGRDRDAWRQRMIENGMLAGAFYALRISFIQCLRQHQVRIPIGLIGEDVFVSWLVRSDDWRSSLSVEEGPRCIFHRKAEFSFRSLSPWLPSDYQTYLHRKWRYMLRGLQCQMLVALITKQGLNALPPDVDELYRMGPIPSRLRWIGIETPLRTIAVQWIRAFRKRR